MAHFAQIDDNNVVVQVIVVGNDSIHNLPFPASEPVGVAFCQSLLGAGTNWKQTSYNNNFRKNYAQIGSAYNLALDAFIAPQPFPSWVLNTGTCRWEAPVDYPKDGKFYVWDEPTVSWVEVS
jgi:hypothetical protein